ncbi:YqzE family protein [Evansella clarkii]|uniref:YqzE family protein n=1 Tax=Evansella clarkii TaxID=79879 RepID=UPI00099693BB|nr:YqzE family protein [Evansella clarkii]
MKTNDYIKYMTQQIVSYADLPKEERLAKREEKRSARQPGIYHWFGLLPYAIMQPLKSIKRSKRGRRH